MLIHSPSVPTSTNEVQVQCLYHWLSFCCQFPLVDVSAPFPSVATTSNGVLNSSAPTRVFSASPFFNPTWVGHYVAVRDPNNASNTCLVVITAFISSVEVQCNAPIANFNVSSTGVLLDVFDPASAPTVGDYFVIQNRITGQVNWQVKVEIDVGPSVLVTMAPIGGWDPGGGVFNLPACNDVLLWTTVAQTFFAADPEVGWWSLLAEETGGIGSDRNMVWAGSLSPFHAPSVSGFPSDTSFAAIFGSNTAVSDNISRDTSNSDNFCVGESLDQSLVSVPLRIMQKRTFSGNDIMALVGSITNPRSGTQDDYDAVVLEPTPGWRGRLPGIRILNDNIANRTLLNSGATYVIGNGIGISWNGKPII